MLKYVPDFMPASIFLIGAGGTGSRLMPALAQLVRTCLKKYNPNAWLDKLPIFVIDGDSVEEKNLFTGKKEHLGYFSTPEDAHESWRKRKHELAQLVAARESDPRVVAALKKRYSVEEWYK
jgi:hypothetical protein